IRQVNAYRPFTRKVRERITLRKSPSSTHHHSSQSRRSAEGNPSSASSARSERTTGSHTSPCAALPARKSSTTSEVVVCNGSNVPLPLAVSNKYQVGAVIGTGNFAVVMECRDK
ncbi:serine/threonine-protein kinase DCLK1-like, partial [Elysia marginata]